MKHLKIDEKISRCGDCVYNDYDDCYGNFCCHDVMKHEDAQIKDSSIILENCPLDDID